MRSGLLALVALGALAALPVPVPQGFVTDTAQALAPQTRARLTRLLEELQQKTGAEIAVVTVETTQPQDDFSYAMEIAERWKPGRRGEDTGVVVLLAVADRTLRILVGYGLEGVLPDGLVGEIQDREMVPAFRAGRIDDGLWRGVAELATRIAAARGVTLTGAPVARRAPSPGPLPGWAVVLLVVLVVLTLIVMTQAPGARRRVRRRGGDFDLPGGSSGGGFPGGGWGGGGGGFGGFGGGSFGGGGAGRSW